MAKPALYDPNQLIQAGIDPKTKLPLAMRNCISGISKDDVRKVLRVVDEQDAVNRYTWTGLPRGLSGKLIERILYYRGSGMLFQLDGQFYFLPYTLNAPENSTGIDVYGRYTGVSPLPFNGTQNDGDAEKPWIAGLIFKPYYEVFGELDTMEMSQEELKAAINRGCVLLHDYTPQRSQTIISRQQLNDPILGLMSECLPYMRTALRNSTGIQGMRVGSEAETQNVDAANVAIDRAALEGRKWVPMVGAMEFQDLSGGEVAKAEEFLLALQSLDNFRLSLYGLDNGGLFQKRSHMLEAEQEMNAGTTGLVAEDGLSNRQFFALIANSLWGTQIWCMPNETTLGIDRDGDMVAGNDGEAAAEVKKTVKQEASNDV